MQRKRGELVPIGEVVSGLDDELVAAIRDDSPQARRSFTVADQVNQLISASEADPDLGFMARMMALCSLPGSATRCGGSLTPMSGWSTKTRIVFQVAVGALFVGMVLYLVWRGWIEKRPK